MELLNFLLYYCISFVETTSLWFQCVEALMLLIMILIKLIK